MSDYSTSANVVLTVNGKQAQKMLSQLEKDAKRLEQGISKAAAAGDKATMKRLQRELNNTNKMMEQLRGTAFNVDNVLRRLDSATPKELNKALRQLQQQLNGIQRGTAAWDAHVAKIKAVKEELRRVNDSMRLDRSLGDKVSDWVNKWQTMLMGAAAVVTGMVLAGRKAVNAYAEMEQEMANVRKFTGMTAEEVEALNVELKKIDTRTPREELNRLAQEAGRLGKSSQEDVLGFVRAADKINVALDDLGDGATLTLSKLTGIFGDEKRLGTERSLLAVGSVINELSQNCSASAPYIAEFASRLGGVGSQAKMTVQQIMGFAAVLDSNNQKLEASSTALSQVIVRIYQNPEKYARVAGMNVSRFARLVREDMNAALIEFLSALSRAGNMDVLSPMFKDMGENGSRAIAALSTLAGHIDEVRQQQEVANDAFRKATSINQEFDVQNNTVQAGLEKARNRVNELAVELGEKLQPVMKLVVSSSTLMLRALNEMVDFVIRNRVELLALAAAIAVSHVSLVAHTLQVTLATKGLTLWNAAIRLCTTILPAMKLVIAGATNAVQYFTQGLQVNYSMQQRWSKAMAAMKFSSWISLVIMLGAAVYSLVNRYRQAREAAEQARIEQEKLARAMVDINEASAKYAADELTRLDSLYKAATDNAKSMDKRTKAAETLMRLYPTIFGNLDTETIMLGKASLAYMKLRNAILESARARAAADKIRENSKEILELEGQEDDLVTDAARKKAEFLRRKQAKEKSDEAIDYFYAPDNPYLAEAMKMQPDTDLDQAELDYIKAETALLENKNRRLRLQAANRELADKYTDAQKYLSESETETVATPDTGADYTPSRWPSKPDNEDRFAAEKAWRAEQEALARIAYATGKRDYIDFTDRMNEIAEDFYEQQLLHTDLSEAERTEITAKWREAQQKRSEQWYAMDAETEELRYAGELATLGQYYLDDEISRDTYRQKVEEAEIAHQRRLVSIYAEGSDKRLAAEKQLSQLLLAQKERAAQETQRLEQKYSSMKQKYFGDNPQERQSKYEADLAALRVVYDREIAAASDNAAEKLRIEEAYQKAKLALAKQYGVQGAEENRNVMQKMSDDVTSWLESDGGKAVTGALDTLVSGMSSIFSGLSTMVQAELEIQTAAINKRYDAEIAAAEGNSYKIAKLEKQKEKEIAKAKNEANRKMFAMQVIQAVAQTAQNALAAYGSAAQIPVVGHILAPIAAAMAVAAGAIQIAAIKKQQQASEAQGYSEGGFTPPGRRDEAVGVVHAGEWVASQRLVNNPRTRPLLEALDYAQRTNTIGSITDADVSRSVTAPMLLAAQPSAPVPVVTAPPATVVVKESPRLEAVMDRLDSRLNEPFVTVNTVSGDHGIQRAQEDYDRLMRNKSPKTKTSKNK